MNKEESFAEAVLKLSINWNLIAPRAMVSPDRKLAMDYSIKIFNHQRDKYEKLLAEKDKQLERAREVFAYISASCFDLASAENVSAEWLKQFKESE